jgi:hypothetical protein
MRCICPHCRKSTVPIIAKLFVSSDRPIACALCKGRSFITSTIAYWLLLFFIFAALALPLDTLASADDQPELDGNDWQLPSYFRTSTTHVDTLQMELRLHPQNRFDRVSLTMVCSPLSDSDIKRYTKKHYFGVGLGWGAPVCLLSKFDLKLNGISQKIPKQVMRLFAEVPALESIVTSQSGGSFMLGFASETGGTGRYQARLTFRNNRLVKRQVYGLDPKIPTFRLMVETF